MLESDAPYVKYHAMWYLALLSLSQGDPMGAHVWLCNLGHRRATEHLPALSTRSDR